MPRAFRYVLVDVFTDTPLEGNQLAVFTDAREIPEDKLQKIARELNLSETVFCYPSGWSDPATRQRSQGETGSQVPLGRDNDEETVYGFPPENDGHVKVRIFTPGAELPFAGHPVLGTAFVLGGPLQLVEIKLETGAGTVPIRLEREGARIVYGAMRQPPAASEPFDRTPELLAALGAESTDLPVELYHQGPGHIFVELASPEAVAALAPDFHALARLTSAGAACFARAGNRWKVRDFLPAIGIEEDPATGSAAGPLALHLARHGRVAFGEEIEISQGAEIGRPSTLYAVAHSPEHVEVGGSAVIVARGEFQL